MWAEPAKPFAEVKPSQREFSRKRFGFSDIFRYLVPISVLHSEPCLWSAAYEQGPRGREGRAFYPRGQEARMSLSPPGCSEASSPHMPEHLRPLGSILTSSHQPFRLDSLSVQPDTLSTFLSWRGRNFHSGKRSSQTPAVQTP